MIARRARELRALGEKKKAAFQAAQTGRTMRVLTLNRSGKDASGPWTRAISGNYLDVRVAGRWPANQFLDIRITGVKDGTLAGVASRELAFRTRACPGSRMIVGFAKRDAEKLGYVGLVPEHGNKDSVISNEVLTRT